MSPIRKVDDFRSVEIDSWDEYVQDELAAGIARGEFEALPDQGKPIRIWHTEINPEYDLAFSRLKNAGVLPAWMELDQKVGRLEAELRSELDRAEAELRAMIAAHRAAVVREPDHRSVWQRFRTWFRTDFTTTETAPPSMNAIMASREYERRRFLQRAAELDKAICDYHDALPKGGEHLQRLRWLPNRAERAYDERITLVQWWDESRT